MAARRQRKVELYEVFAYRKSFRGDGEPAAEEKPRPRGEEPPPPKRTGRELVFSVEAGFVLFVAVLVLLGTAYKLGWDQHNLAGAGFERMPEPGVIQPRDAVGRVEGAEGVPVQRTVSVSPDRWTLHLMYSDDHTEAALERLRIHQAYLAVLPEVRERGATVLILDNGTVFSLGVGAYETAEHRHLLALKAGLEEDPGPRVSESPTPYAGCKAVRIGDLGKAVP